jgi:hypothetical protein
MRDNLIINEDEKTVETKCAFMISLLLFYGITSGNNIKKQNSNGRAEVWKKYFFQKEIDFASCKSIINNSYNQKSEEGRLRSFYNTERYVLAELNTIIRGKKTTIASRIDKNELLDF